MRRIYSKRLVQISRHVVLQQSSDGCTAAAGNACSTTDLDQKLLGWGGPNV